MEKFNYLCKVTWWDGDKECYDYVVLQEESLSVAAGVLQDWYQDELIKVEIDVLEYDLVRINEELYELYKKGEF